MNSNDNNHFEQYKMAINSVDKISERRMKANGFFISLNTLILGTVFINITSIKFRILVCIFGILLSFIWYEIIENYSKLNEAKFKIIFKMEKKGLFNFYEKEWKILEKNNYKGFSKIEQYVPLLFLALYYIILLYYLIVKYILPFIYKNHL